MKYYIKKYSSLLAYYIRDYREEVKTGLIAFVITILTYSFLNYSYNNVEEIEPVEIEILEVPEVDQDFIDDIRGALEEPDIVSDTNERFIASLDTCIDYVYLSVSPERQLPRKLILAQAILESAWGKSRFANEGNNLFGIRTWNKDVPYLLPIPWTEWPGWGVKMYSSKCESVVDYLHILNNVHAFEELRMARANGVKDALELANYLDKYASKPTYVELVKEIIQYNIRGVYEL